MKGVHGNGIKTDPFNFPWHAQALVCIEIVPGLETVHRTSTVDPTSTWIFLTELHLENRFSYLQVRPEEKVLPLSQSCSQE